MPPSNHAPAATGGTGSLRGQAILIGLALLASGAVLALLLHLAGLTIDLRGTDVLPFYAGGTVALGLRFGLPRLRWRHARAVGHCAEYYALFTAIALMGAVASYPVAALSHGYADDTLQRIDELLGFDWLAWYRAVAGSTMLQALGTAAYRSIYLSPAVLLAYHAATRQRAAAYRFVASFWLCAVVTLALFALMPAVGPFSYLWHGPIPYMPESELWQPDLIPQLRAHQVHIIDLGHLRGLVSAPSFHAAAALVYAAAAWRARPLRWPLLALNALMLLSTPVEGTHYLADILLGLVVAGATLWVTDRALRRYQPEL